MTEHIYQYGQLIGPAELVQRATGKSVSPLPLLRHLREKCNEGYVVCREYAEYLSRLCWTPVFGCFPKMPRTAWRVILGVTACPQKHRAFHVGTDRQLERVIAIPETSRHRAMNTTSSRTDLSRDPIITTCPDCGAFVKLPACVNIEAMVQCPTCNDRYPVRALLPDLIPELIVVRGDGELSPKPDMVQVGATETANQLELVASVPSLLEVPDILRNGSRRRRRKSGKPGVESPNSEATRLRRSDADRKQKRKSQRNRTSHAWAEESKRSVKPRVPAVEFAKVVMGALLALPVAQIIIWWMIGLDPLHVAPTVSRIAPFIVPAKLRPDEGQQTTGFWTGEQDNHLSVTG